MSEVSDVEIGRLIQTVQNLSNEVHELRTIEMPALRAYVKTLEDRTNRQEILITKGKTIFLVVCGGIGALWGIVELYVRTKF